MNFVVIDLEFNNMRENAKGMPRSNNKCPNEIIQIGAVKLDKHFREIGTLRLYVKPVVYKVINPVVSEITGISMEDLEKGMSFKEAVEILGAFVDEESIICSWAKDDAVELIRNCKYHGIRNIEWLRQYADMQEYCTKVMAEKNVLGLKTAMKKLNVEFTEDKLHDALNDCFYSIEVMKKVFNFKAFQGYIMENICAMSIAAIRGKDDAEALSQAI